VQGEIEQGELPEAHERSDEHHGAPGGGWALDEEHRRDGDENESHGQKDQRRNAGKSLIDHDEVDAPDHGNEQGEGCVFRGHQLTLSVLAMKEQRCLLPLFQ
jgi:hypothetical protein